MKVVITGSTKGLGHALAREFLDQGDDVIVCSRDQTRVNSTISQLREEFPERKVHGTTCDVRDPPSVVNLGKFAVDQLGTVDIWVNNAGTKGKDRNPLWKVDPVDLQLVVGTNLLGTYYGCQVAFKIMLAQGHGKVFNMYGLGSNGMASPFAAAYGSTKAALPQLMKTLIKELKKANKEHDTKVAIHATSPGMVLTDLLVQGVEPSNFKIFNILAERPETVAGYLVPRMRKVKGMGKYINFLPTWKAAGRFMTAWRFKNRWFDAAGNRKY